MEGWISLHRNIKEHWIWNDPVKFQWWIDILLTVNHSDSKILIGNNLIECKRGQSIMSLKNWAERWKCSKDSTRNFIRLLEKDGMILHENLLKTTRLTVCNYDKYQSVLHADPTHDSTMHQHMTRRCTNTNNNVNNDNKKNNDNNILLSEIKISDIPVNEKIYYDIAKGYWELININLRELKIESKELKNAKYKTWINPIRLMIESDKRNIDDIKEIYKYLKNEKPETNGFSWKQNVRSTSSLRKYFEKILIKARTKNGKREKARVSDAAKQAGSYGEL